MVETTALEHCDNMLSGLHGSRNLQVLIPYHKMILPGWSVSAHKIGTTANRQITIPVLHSKMARRGIGNLILIYTQQNNLDIIQSDPR